jgi:hypothetical protein
MHRSSLPGGHPGAWALACAALVLGCRERPPPALGAGFVDVTGAVELPAPAPTPANAEPETTWALFADVDADGRSDVVAGSSQGIAAFTWDGRSLAPLPFDSSAGSFVGFLDVDGDGRGDLVLSSHGGPIAFASASGRRVWSDVTPPPPPGEFGAVWLDDVDEDGWLDLVGADHGQCEEDARLRLYLRDGLRSFRDHTARVDSRVPMVLGHGALWSGPLGDLGWHLVAVATPCDETSPILYRRGALDSAGYPLLVADNEALERHVVGGQYPWSVYVHRLAPMGFAIGDLDGDGLFDAALSGAPELRTWRGGPAAPLQPQTGWTGSLLARLPGRPWMIPWAVAMVDLDRDGRLDVLATRGVKAEASPTLGVQRVTLHRFIEGDELQDISTAAGFTRDGDWRTLALGDPDGDGAPDLLVGGVGLPPRAYANRVTGGRALGLRLHGTTSNNLGVGSRVEVRSPAGELLANLVAGSWAGPVILNEPLVFAGLGPHDAADARVVWPSGTVQQLNSLAAGRLHDVTEPVVLEVLPRTRHARLGSDDTLTIRVTPRASDGSVRAAVVTARVVAGEATLAPFVPAADGTVTLHFTPPPGPGSSVVEVSLDGAPVKVRPRLFWD